MFPPSGGRDRDHRSLRVGTVRSRVSAERRGGTHMCTPTTPLFAQRGHKPCCCAARSQLTRLLPLIEGHAGGKSLGCCFSLRGLRSQHSEKVDGVVEEVVLRLRTLVDAKRTATIKRWEQFRAHPGLVPYLSRRLSRVEGLIQFKQQLGSHKSVKAW